MPDRPNGAPSPEPAATRAPLVAAGIARRMASMLYESLLVFAIAFFAGLAYLAAARGAIVEPLRSVFQCYLLAVLGLYFIGCWHRGGQTLPMKTWKLRLVRRDGATVSVPRATVRYLLACLLIALAGGGFVWAFVDRDRQFLHDRLAGTRIVEADT